MVKGAFIALDTSLATCAGAIVHESGELLASHSELIHRGHAERIGPLVETLLADASAPKIGQILVTRGPGSFTGLRVALSFAQGLAFAQGAKLVGVSTLEAFALSHQEGCKKSVLVLIDARHGRAFSQLFGVENHPLERPSLRKVDDLVAETACLPDLILANEGKFATSLPEAWKSRLIVQASPSMEAFAGAAARGEVTPQAATPLYLREADVGVSKRPNLTRVS